MGQDDLKTVLAGLPHLAGGDLLVDERTSDDAAVLRIDGDRALVQTVDFFTPIVDDPYLFGAIAATNSVSDIYAMGARPILGLAIAGFPTDVLPLSMLEEILRGGAEKAAEAGFPVAGGHTIIDDVPKYGLAVTGLAPVDGIVRNSTGRPGDVLFLTKPLGNGILVSAWRGTTGGKVSKILRRQAPDLDEAIRWMVTLNGEASRAMVESGASAATDVTGYGLVGHLLEMCRDGIGARLELEAIPELPGARDWLDRGFFPGGSARNLAAYQSAVRIDGPSADIRLLVDAQTSGGLLVAVPADRASVLEDAFRRRGVFFSRIGALTDESGVIRVVA